MKKRVVSWLLVVLMLTSLLPTSVLAEMVDAAASTAVEQPLTEDAAVPKEPEEQEGSKTPEAPETPEVPEDTENTDDAEQEAGPQSAVQSADIMVQAAAVTEISTAAEFAGMSATGSYKLTKDITVTAPYKKADFTGTFDGDNHTITFTYDSTGNVNAGLFLRTGKNAVIKNLKVEVALTSTAASASCGTGGLVGTVYGATTITNCHISGNVQNTNKGSSYSAAYVGGLVGYQNDALTVDGCSANVKVQNANTASSAATGGLLGKGNSSYALTIKDSVAKGDVTAAKGSAGGFVGCDSGSASKAHTYTNCGAQGTVTAGTANQACGFIYISSNASYIKFTDCYWASETALGCNKTVKGLAQQENIDPNAKYTVNFVLDPASSVLTWKDTEQPVSEDGKYSFSDVAVGDHAYSVKNTTDDYADKPGTVSVKNKDITESVTLELKTYDLKFTGLPDDAALTVKDSTGKTVAGKSNAYSVPRGTYTYTVTGAFRYEDLTGEVTINAGAEGSTTVDVSKDLTAKPAVTVTFVYSDDVANAKITVKQGYTSMPAEADGSYKLPVGRVYSWAFSSDNYIDQAGTLDLTKEAGGTSKSVPVPMSKKPALVDGCYQLGSADDLAWFRDQVNSGTGRAWNAKLTANITLEGSWTPIGKSSSSYRGTFDGQGYTIGGLNISAGAEDYQGLFGYVSGGTIENLVVDGTVTGKNNTAGIVGYLTSSGIVRKCVNKANVTGNNSVGGIVGQVSSVAAVEDCYNRGDIKTGYYAGKAGGIVGYLYAYSTSYKNTVSRCYSTGTITGGSAAAAVIGSINNKNCSIVEDLYFLEGAGTDSNAVSKSDADLKALAPTLGNAFHEDVKDVAGKYINDGYPILTYQLPPCTVTLTVFPADAEVTVDGKALTGGITAGQVTTYTAELSYGKHSYTASAFGYVSKLNERFTVSASGPVNIELAEAEKRTITLRVTPADAEAAVTVTWKDRPIAAASGTTYELPDGEYSYTVTAKGYDQVTAALSVSAESDGTEILVELACRAPETDTNGVYQIGTRTELAWFRDQINSGKNYSAVLTADIDLKNQDWTPIGKAEHPFTGIFDGAGHTVSGLKVTGAPNAGLFGAGSGATIQNVVVSGTVSGTNAAGILAQTVTAACTIRNCGSTAAVTGTDYVGGIVGLAAADVTVTACYNSGTVAADKDAYSRAGGIVGGEKNRTITVTDSYNVGPVSSTGYAAGILGGAVNGSITRCYNAGTVSGADNTKTGAITTNTKASDYVISCCYLAGGAATPGAEAMSSGALRADALPLLGEEWETVRGANSGYPVLKWQGLPPAAASDTAAAAKDARFQRDPYTTDSGEESSRTTGVLEWTPVSGAASYTVTLWRADKTWIPFTEEEFKNFHATNDPEEKLWLVDDAKFVERANADAALRTELAQLDAAITAASDSGNFNDLAAAYAARAAFVAKNITDAELGHYELVLCHAADFTGVAGAASGGKLTYDLSPQFAAMEEGYYYATVTAETDGQPAYMSLERAQNIAVGVQDPYDRMKAVTGIQWKQVKLGENETTKEPIYGSAPIALWDARPMTSGQKYQLDLYTVTDSGRTLFKSFLVSGSDTTLDLSKIVAAGKTYSFTVTALADADATHQTLADSLPSAYSDNASFDAESITEPETPKEWVAISSAAEWIKISAIDDDAKNSTGESLQKIAWSKNYYLASDIDFSQLSAADQTKTKSIGSKNYPFSGEFSGIDRTTGQQHVIKGLTLSNSDAGLFWYTDAGSYIHDVTIDSANVLFSDNAAVLVCNSYGLVDNCAVINTNITADTGAVLGGMISRNYGYIRNSYVEGGSLTSNSTSSVGHAGFVGANETGGRIENCWTSMTVSTQSEHAGGFVGLGYGGTIRNCFALGDVSARGYSGGFIGRYVYNGNITENCYAAGTVTVTGDEGNGFNGGNQSWSSFQYEQTQGTKNCYYNSATRSSHDYGAVGKSLSDMKAGGFLTLLDQDGGIWAQRADKNNGLPYLKNVKAPETARTETITVKLAVASYNKSTYAFEQMGDTLSVTMESTGNTRLVDLMDAAQEQGLLTYSYASTSTFGRFIHTINGRAVDAPDGWMFTVNDVLSNVSASLASVKNGDRVLWFEGTTENLFHGPTWDELGSSQLTWVTISTVTQLEELAKAADAETLSKNYKLANDLDLNGMEFSGIGSSDHPFTGRFDGQGHTISNVKISKDGGTGVGFFNAIRGATIKNLNLKDVSVTGGTNVGGLVGDAQVKLDKNDPAKSVANLIGSCSVSGTVTGRVSVGGLVGLSGGEYDADTGFSIASAVNNCRADVNVTGTGSGSDTNNKLGGLVGSNAGAITASSASGTVAGENMVGGLVGNNTGDIYDSHASGAVAGSTNVGGFVGSSSGIVQRAYSLGSVTGTDRTGSFAGSISNADTAVGAGQVTVTGSSAQGYVGGFAGNLGGTLTGVASKITIKNAYGNCTTADPEKALNVVGNTSQFTSVSAQEALAEMRLTDWNSVNQKLRELFGVSLPGIGEALDLFTDIAIPYGSAKDAAFKLYTGEVTAQITTTVAENDYIIAANGTVTLKKAHDIKNGASFTVTVTLTEGSCTVSKTVTVTLLKQTEALIDSIAATLTGTKDGWTAMDMALYQSLGGKTHKLTDTARQNVIDLLIAEASTDTATASDRSRIEIVLRSLGVDSTRIYPVNSNTPVNNAAKLQAADMSTVMYYTAPYILLANTQGNVKLSDAQIGTLLSTMENSVRDGMLGGTYSGVFYTDADSTGAALAALSSYAGSNSRAKALLATLTSGLKTHVASAGYYSNVYTDAMVILGLTAVGEDPYTYKLANGLSVVDDMLCYALSDGTGFFGYGDKNTADSMATDQGFRALIALAQFQKTGNAFNALDFSSTAVKATHAVGTGETEKPKDPEETEEKISVTVTISTPSGTWFSGSVKLNQGSTVYHALSAALQAGNISAAGAANGYVRSMTKDGVTYGEFTSGKNSGWLYKVNGILPSIPLTQCGIKNGDSILWYYTLDWTKDPDAGKMADGEVTAADVIKLIDAIGTVSKDSGNAIAAARTAYNKLSDAEKALVTNYDKLLSAETAYAEIQKAQQEKTNTEGVTGWKKTYQDALDAVKTDQLAFGSEWLVIALARSGRPVPDSYYDSVVKAVQDAKGELSDKKFTEYSRTILALTAIGKDPSNVGGYDLLAKLADMDDVTYQGLNGAVFALLALDSGKYDVPAAAEDRRQTTRDGLVAYLLEQQLTDGGWALSGSSADPDMTAMVLQALAPYRAGSAEVQTAVDKAVQTLSELQQADGGYSSWGTLNSESCAQVLIALAALGIDPAKDSRFAKNGLTLLDALLAYVLDNGFRHTMDGAVDAMATEQALCALTAYARLLDGKTAFYDMTDVLSDQVADTPDDHAVPDGQPRQGVSVVVWISLGVAAVGGAAFVIARRRREK